MPMTPESGELLARIQWAYIKETIREILDLADDDTKKKIEPELKRLKAKHKPEKEDE